MDLSLRPGENECFGFHRDYIAKVPDGNILETLKKQMLQITEFIGAIDSNQWEVIHPPYGWSVRTVVEHCCDAERVFGYRALRFATGDETELPGWDENHYASCGYCIVVEPADLAAEMEAIRAGNLKLLTRLDTSAWGRMGKADGRAMSVRTIAWLMAGHWMHHHAILKERLAS